MNTETALQTAGTLLADWAKNTANPEANRLDITIDPVDLTACVRALDDSKWGYLSAITGLDSGPETGIMEALYHFCHGAAITTLRVTMPRTDACVPSVCKWLPYASLYERELMEMFGVKVTGTPNPERLFLPDDWTAGIYPGRKDFNLNSAPVSVSGENGTSAEEYGPVSTSGERFVVPIGPQHPALKEPGHFEFTVDGEIVTGASVRLGYVHRGMEKA